MKENFDDQRPYGELYMYKNGEAHFISHTSGTDFDQAEVALRKFIVLLQWQIDNRDKCPFYTGKSN